MNLIPDECPYCGSPRKKGTYEYRPYVCGSFPHNLFVDHRVIPLERCKDNQLHIAESLIREAVRNIDFYQRADHTLCRCGGVMGYSETHNPQCLMVRIENFLIARERADKNARIQNS